MSAGRNAPPPMSPTARATVETDRDDAGGARRKFGHAIPRLAGKPARPSLHNAQSARQSAKASAAAEAWVRQSCLHGPAAWPPAALLRSRPGLDPDPAISSKRTRA
jgi:hypothetical protein